MNFIFWSQLTSVAFFKLRLMPALFINVCELISTGLVDVFGLMNAFYWLLGSWCSA